MKYKLGEIYKLSRRRQWKEKDLGLYEIMAVNFSELEKVINLRPWELNKSWGKVKIHNSHLDRWYWTLNMQDKPKSKDKKHYRKKKIYVYVGQRERRSPRKSNYTNKFLTVKTEAPRPYNNIIHVFR